MNTIQLTLDMMKNNKVKRKFKGVFPADKLPRRIKRPAMLIANTEPSTHPGSHWVAFCFPHRGPIEYFDSTGMPLNIDYFLKFLKRHGKKFVSNYKRLQGSLSTTCGNYCGVFLYFRSKNVSFKNFLGLFSEDYAANDQKILEMYRKIFNLPKKKIQIGGNQIICNQSCRPCEI